MNSEKTKPPSDKLTVIEGEIAGFEIDPRSYHYPPGAEFKNCNVKISKDGKEIKLEYLLVPDMLINNLKNIGDTITIYYIKEYEGGFVFALKNNGKIKEDIKDVLKARKIAIRLVKDSKDNIAVFERVFGLNTSTNQISRIRSPIITIILLVISFLIIALLYKYIYNYFVFNKTFFQTALFIAAIASFSAGYFIENKLLKNKFEKMLKEENLNSAKINKWLKES